MDIIEILQYKYKYKKGDTVKYKYFFNKKLNEYCFIVNNTDLISDFNYCEVLSLKIINSDKFSFSIDFSNESDFITSRAFLVEKLYKKNNRI